jgi:hypothetical protein
LYAELLEAPPLYAEALEASLFPKKRKLISKMEKNINRF